MLDSWFLDRRRRALASDGVLVVRNLVSAHVATELNRIADRLYALLPGETDLQGEIEEALAGNLRQWGGIWFAGALPYLARTKPDAHERFAKLLGEIEQRSLSLLGSGWNICLDRSYFRCQIGEERYLPWHIDADAARTIDVSPESVNVWFPLIAVGRSAPSLEFVSGSHHQMRQAVLNFDATKKRTQEEIDLIKGQRFSPKLRPGDVAIFDHYTLHRTQKLLPFVGKVRVACEIRFMGS